MKKTSSFWKNQISAVLDESTEIPMWGCAPPFPFDAFSKSLQEAWNLPSCDVKLLSAEWITPEKVEKEITGNTIFKVDINPIGAPIYLSVTPDNQAVCIQALMNTKTSSANFSSREIQKGFFQFILLEAIGALSSVKKDLQFSLHEADTKIISDNTYVMKVVVTSENFSFEATLLVSKGFQQKFKTNYNKKIPLDTATKDKIVLCNLKVGCVTLQADQIAKLTIGDFVILDSASYHPKTKKGTMELCFQDTPLFHIKHKEESIKILDYATPFEETTMEKPNEKPAPEQKPMEEASVEIETNTEETTESETIHEVEKSAPISAEKIPVTIKVEVAKLPMTLEKLSNLQIGNVIDTSIHIDHGVDLTVNGEVIGRGELLQLGDIIGVKITELG